MKFRARVPTIAHSRIFSFKFFFSYLIIVAKFRWLNNAAVEICGSDGCGVAFNIIYYHICRIWRRITIEIARIIPS